MSPPPEGPVPAWPASTPGQSTSDPRASRGRQRRDGRTGTEHRPLAQAASQTQPLLGTGTERTGRPACSSRSLGQARRPSGVTDLLGERPGHPHWRGEGSAFLPGPPPSLTRAWLCPQGSVCSATFPNPRGANRHPQRGRAGRAGQRKGEALHPASPRGGSRRPPLGQCPGLPSWGCTRDTLLAQTVGT